MWFVDGVGCGIRFCLQCKVVVLVVKKRIVQLVGRSAGRWERQSLYLGHCGRGAEVGIEVGFCGGGWTAGCTGLTVSYRWVCAVCTGCAQANVRDLRGGDAGSACAGTVELVLY